MRTTRPPRRFTLIKLVVVIANIRGAHRSIAPRRPGRPRGREVGPVHEQPKQIVSADGKSAAGQPELSNHRLSEERRGP